MIYFTLPNFYHNREIHNFFVTLVYQHTDWLKYPVTFTTVTGCFPYCYFNGTYNFNINNEGALFNEINDYVNQTILPIRLNFSNIFLKEDDFEDTYSNIILRLLENGSTTIELSNLKLLYYIKEKYPNYNFIYSSNTELMLEQTSDIINLLIEENLFKLISVHECKVFDKKFLDNIIDPKKIEIPINSLCNMDCDKYAQCQYNTCLDIYNFKNNSIYEKCLIKNNYQDKKTFFSLEDIIKNFVPKGFTHFRLAEMYNNNSNDLFIFLIKYFFKEEYQKEALIKYIEWSEKL